MKRFYCETCKKVRRVRKLPSNAAENLNAAAIIKVIGDCNSHYGSRSAYLKTLRPTSTSPVKKFNDNKVVASVTVKRGKR